MGVYSLTLLFKIEEKIKKTLGNSFLLLSQDGIVCNGIKSALADGYPHTGLPLIRIVGGVVFEARL